MPGNEVHLISRYFGGPSLRWARGIVADAKESVFSEGVSSTGPVPAAGQGQHVHASHGSAMKKPILNDDELMQVMFNKFNSTSYQGPVQTDIWPEPGH